MQFILGALAAALISGLAYAAQALTLRGIAASLILGTLIVGFGGWTWALVLLAFFVTSSVLSKACGACKVRLNNEYAKGGRRDAGQVLANGSTAIAFIMLHVAFPQAAWPWIGYGGALAAVNADTWATELGVLSSSRPRLITRPQMQVEAGTSGAVSAVGTAAALAGSAWIALCVAMLWSGADRGVFAAILLGGFLGALFDSVIAVTLQGMYYCPVDRRETEKHPLHSCGSPTTLLRGWSWLSNDWVNVGCGTFGALAALGAASLLWRL